MENKLDKNIVVKREYQVWLKYTQGFAEPTITGRMRAIKLYEECTGNEDFSKYNSQKGIDFQEWLSDRKFNGKPISSNTKRAILINLKKYFVWLREQSGYKSKINKNSFEYLNPSRKESAIANADHLKEFPSKEYICKLVNSIKGEDEISKRNRALISFTYLTGMRDSAIISLSLRCVKIKELYIKQEPRLGVNTKFSKTNYPKIFKFDEALLKYVTDWYGYLFDKGFKPDNPLFPRAKNVLSPNIYSFQEAVEVEPCFWKSTTSIRQIFKNYEKEIGSDYYPPHSFRHSAIISALGLLQNGLDLKAISQNFGHKDVLLVLSVYGQLSPNEQLRQLNDMENKKRIEKTDDPIFDEVHAFAENIKRKIVNGKSAIYTG
ncbi:MAG: tyrosine-type recombinase/integrase [Bacteroidetes bacterium]|nr:tyrosine-type recombinase/integrase [Bacteroidota bacterium]